MNSQLLLKELENLSERAQDGLLNQLMEDLELDSPEKAKQVLREQLDAFESAHKMTLEQMLENIDCEKLEKEPKLSRWAAIYYSYKEIAIGSPAPQSEFASKQ